MKLLNKILILSVFKVSTITAEFAVVNYIQRARKIDFTQEQAEFNAQELEHLIESIADNAKIATKSDIAVTIVNLEVKLIKWIIGTGMASVLAIAGLLKFLIH